MKLLVRIALLLLFPLALASCDSEPTSTATTPTNGVQPNQNFNGPNPAAPLYTYKDFAPLRDQNGRIIYGIQRPNDPRGDSVLFGGLSFELGSTFYLGRAIVRNGEHEGGMIDDKGSFVLPMDFHKISSISDSGLVEVAKLDSGSRKIKEGVYNIDGEVIVPLEYDRADLMLRGRLIKVGNGRRVGLVDATGKELLPIEYQEINRFSEGFATVKKGGVYGLIDETGTVVVKPQYQALKEFRQGITLAKENGSYFIMDETFKNINGELYQAFATISYIDPQTGRFGDNFGIPLDTITRQTFLTADGNIAVAQSNKWGVVGAAGDIVLPFEYKSVGLKGGEWYGVE